MKKKLLLFLAVTLAGLAIYSCTRDTDTSYPDVPNPDPLTNEALLRARDFLDFEIGSPVLPNTYLRAGSDASQTRAADKQSYLYDAIQPDWSQARVWTSDSLTITEVPAQLTRPIRYTVLFEHLEDTISYKTQAPYTRIVFNERKNPDTMYCFLVTFLPDESYIGNPALRSSNPSGSDYSGLTIYSHPDGTPAWGWRYDTGEITHTLPFDESYRDQSDPVYRLRIDFGSDEYSTRGLDDVNNLDEVLVPGYKPVPTPDLYRWSTSEAEDLIDLGDGRLGGDGGPSGDQNNTLKPKEVPCSEKAQENMLNSNQNWDAFIKKDLQTKFLDLYRNESVEWTVSLNYDSNKNSYTMTKPRTDNSSSRVTAYITVGVHENTVATIHNHPNSSVPSIADASGLAYGYDKTNGHCTTDYIACANGDTYALQVESGAAAMNFGNRYFNNETMQKSFTTEFNNLRAEFQQKGLDYQEASLYALAYLLSLENSGIKLMKMQNGNFIQKHAYRDGATTKIETCKK